MRDTYFAFACTDTDGESAGIYTSLLDPNAGTIEAVDATDASPNPSFLTIHPNGQYLYAVNEIDDATAGLSLVDRVSTKGEWPRHFAITPDSEHLLVEIRETDDTVTFEIDGVDGTFSATGVVRDVPGPVCLQFLGAEQRPGAIPSVC